MKTIQTFIISALFAATFFSSCKKDEIEPDNGNNAYDPVNVLNDNSGYEQSRLRVFYQ